MADNILYKQTWLDLVFKDKNKVYGAYFLRQLYEKNVVAAVLFSVTVFALAIAAPVIATKFFSKEDEVIEELIKPKVTDYVAPPEDPKDIPPPPPIEPPKVEMAKFLPPVPKPDEQVVEEIKSMDELKDKPVGAIDQEGDPNAFGAVEVEKEVIVADIKDEYTLDEVTEIPQYPGGMPQLYKLFGNNIKYPKQAEKLGIGGKVIVGFTVSADGSISNFRVIKQLGYGLDEEAIRLAKLMTNWIPAKMGAKPVKIGTMQIPVQFQPPADDEDE